ncbi:MAG: hypothetical protein D084_Lepto4C00311G0003, partial [Leptospirillum sp. Group IV 'UBA BS']
RPASIHITLSGMPLAQLAAPSLTFYLGGPYSEGSNLFFLLTRNLESIEIAVPGEPSTFLGPEALKAPSFGDDSSLFPYSPNSFSAYRLFQEFFVMPSKFLFLELTGRPNWPKRGNGNDAHRHFPPGKESGPAAQPERPEFCAGRCAGRQSLRDGCRTDLAHPSAERNPDSPVGGEPGAFRRLFDRARDGDLEGHRPSRRVSPLSGASRTGSLAFIPRLSGHPKALPDGIPDRDLSGDPLRKGRPACGGNAFGPTSRDEPDASRVAEARRDQPADGQLSRAPCLFQSHRAHPLYPAPRSGTPSPGGSSPSWESTSFPWPTPAASGSLLSVYIFPMERNKGLEDTNRKRIESIDEVRLSRKSRFIRGVLLRGTHILVRVRGDGICRSGRSVSVRVGFERVSVGLCHHQHLHETRNREYLDGREPFMAGTAGYANPDLERLREDLGKKAAGYQFFQAVRLLRLLLAHDEGASFEDEFWNRIAIRPDPVFGFPPP